MIRMKTANGEEVILDGEHAEAALDHLKTAFANKLTINKIKSLLVAMRQDLRFLVHQYDDDPEVAGEMVLLTGTRRLQFDWVRAYLKENPKSSFHAACAIAIKEINGPGGYATARSFSRYCCAHRHLLGIPQE